MKMFALRSLIASVASMLLFQFSIAHAQTPSQVGKSWIPSSFPFDTSLPVAEQAQQWALCSATLEIFSDLIRQNMGKPDTATNIKNFSNGAAVAIIGVFIMDTAASVKDKSEAEINKSLQQVVKYAQFASDDYPKAAKARIGMMRENARSQDQWLADLLESSKSCMQQQVLELQQTYIDTARMVLLGVGR